MKVSRQILLALILITSSLSSALAAPPAKKSTAKAPAAKPAKAAASAPAAGGNSAVYNDYANQMRQKMANNWNYPNGTNHVTLVVEVAQDGSVSNLTLSSSPKNTEAEQKANDAFNSAQPLQPLPSGNGATITCVFDSKADQWDSKANISVKIDPAKSPAAAAPAGDSGKQEEEKK